MKYLSLIILFTLLANSDIENPVNLKDITLTKVVVKDKKIINAEKELAFILQSIKKYKKNKNIQIKKLKGKIQTLRQNFTKQQNRKSRKIKKLEEELLLIKKKLIKKEPNQKDKKIKRLEKELLLTKRKLIKKENKIVELQTNINVAATNEIETEVVTVVTPKTWIKIIVENNYNIYDLALKYYGDSQEYTRIYAANKNIINSNYQINNGMSLIIPITERFQEQPIMLNSN